MPTSPIRPLYLAFSAVILCFGFGVSGRILLESFPNFVTPLSAEFGWDRAAVASIYSMAALANGLSGPLAGRLFDRLGPKRVYIFGLAAGGCGISIASIANELWHFYIGMGILVGLSAACLGNVTNSAFLSRWYRAKLPLALSIVYSSLGIGTFAGFYISQVLILNHGWRTAELWIGGGTLALIPLLMLLPWKSLTRGNPEFGGHGNMSTDLRLTDIGLLHAARNVHFWGLFSIFCFTAMGIFSIVIQAVTYLIERGFDPIAASVNYGFTGILIPFGMMASGTLIVRIGITKTALLSYVMTIAGVGFLWLLTDTAHSWALWGFIICFGLSMGTRGPMVGSLAARIFKGRNFGTIYGAIYMGGGTGAAFGSYFSGTLYDLTGQYDAIFLFSAIALILGSIPLWIFPEFRRQSSI